MSKIVKKPLKIPKGVSVEIKDMGLRYLISVKGPKGSFSKEIFNKFNIKVEGDEVKIDYEKYLNNKKLKPFLGTAYRIIENMIKGVVEGFQKILIVQGVGYRAAVKGKSLVLTVGYSHDVVYEIPDGINIKVEGNSIIVSGIDKEKVGLVASQIRAIRKPDPYKGKGIRYQGENPVRKVGKKAVAGK